MCFHSFISFYSFINLFKKHVLCRVGNPIDYVFVLFLDTCMWYTAERWNEAVKMNFGKNKWCNCEFWVEVRFNCIKWNKMTWKRMNGFLSYVYNIFPAISLWLRKNVPILMLFILYIWRRQYTSLSTFAHTFDMSAHTHVTIRSYAYVILYYSSLCILCIRSFKRGRLGLMNPVTRFWKWVLTKVNSTKRSTYFVIHEIIKSFRWDSIWDKFYYLLAHICSDDEQSPNERDLYPT